MIIQCVQNWSEPWEFIQFSHPVVDSGGKSNLYQLVEVSDLSDPLSDLIVRVPPDEC